MIAMCCGDAVRVMVQVAVPVPVFRRVGFALMAAAVGSAAGLACAAPQAAFAAPVCDAHLSPAQRERFALTLSSCSADVGSQAGPARSDPTVPHADALVASAARPAALSQTRVATQAGASTSARPTPSAAAPVDAAPPESAHLQLFGKPGVVMARMNRPGDAAWTPPPTPAAAGVRKTGRPGTAGAAGTAGMARAPRPAIGSPEDAPGNAREATRAGRPISRAEELSPQVDAVARRHAIDPLLLHAIAHVESRHNPQAQSPAGALGLMQVMPATASRFGVARPEALHQTGTNLEVSAAYLKTLQQRFGNDLSLVLAAYNAGEGAVERHGRRVPPYAETQRYVRQVLERYRLLNQTAVASAF